MAKYTAALGVFAVLLAVVAAFQAAGLNYALLSEHVAFDSLFSVPAAALRLLLVAVIAMYAFALGLRIQRAWGMDAPPECSQGRYPRS